jgi:hypothetical protein
LANDLHRFRIPLDHRRQRHEVVDEARSIDGGMGYDGSLAGPFGSAAPLKAIRRIPASERADHYRRQQAEQSSPFHWWQAGGCKILSQGSWGYCWMFGTVGGMQCAYAQTGIQSPHLNAHYPAWLGKNGRNQGGWAGEALGYIERFGVPEYGAFPGKPTNRAAFDRREARDNAALHKAVEFAELPRNDYDALCSVLLDPIDPRPVTMGLNWWGHLVVALPMDDRRHPHRQFLGRVVGQRWLWRSVAKQISRVRADRNREGNAPMTFTPPPDQYRIDNQSGSPRLRRFVAIFRWPGQRAEVPFRSPGLGGVSPLEVLQQTRAAMSYANEHHPELSGPNEAMALAHVMQAVAALEGKATETADGTPIIQ